MKKYRASKLTVKKLSNEEVKDFLNENHKQGFINAEVCYGLFNGQELLQVETFGKPRIETQNNIIWHDWELLRECSKKGCQIYGGKSRLLKHFEEEYKPFCLLSYCSVTEGFDGHSYAACGFTLERTSKDYWYEYNGEVIKRYRMQKNSNLRKAGKKEPIQKTLESFNKPYDPNLSEKENALNAGFVLKRGSGQQVWTKLYSDFVGYIYDFELGGKHYIGQHTLYKDDSWGDINYNGSGVIWKNAVEKYGARSINKKVLKWYTSEYVMKKMEIHYIRKYGEIYGKENMYNVNYAADATSHLWRLDKYKNKTSIERQKESYKKYWENLSEESKKEIANKKSETMKAYHENLSEEEKEEIYKKVSKSRKTYWKNLSEEEKNVILEKQRKTHQNTLDNMSEEERLSKFGQNKGKTNLWEPSEEQKKKISFSRKTYWENLSEEEKEEIANKTSNTIKEINSKLTPEEIHNKYYRKNAGGWNEGIPRTEEEKKTISATTKEGMKKSKLEAIEWIHQHGFKTREEVMEEKGLSYKQVRAIPVKGYYKKLAYL